jgi:hypothetical protein
MPVTYKKIASVTVGSGGAASMSFSAIPASYDDLVMKLSAREETTNNFEFQLEVNGSTSNIYSWRFIQGNGASAISDSRTAQTNGNAFVLSSSNSTASTFGNAEIYIPNYAGSTNKSVSVDSVGENNGTTAYARLVAFLFSSTSAITSLTIKLTTGDLNEFSSATLYGISKS